MKKHNYVYKIMTILLSMLLCFRISAPALAQESTTSNAAIAFATDYITLRTAIANQASTIIIQNDIILQDSLSINYNVTLASYTEATLTSAAGKYHFQASVSSITITFQNVILDGNSIGGGIYSPVSYLTLDGAIIQNCSSLARNDIYGGAVYSQGWLGLYNCSIKNNSSYSAGGGIYCLQLNAIDCDVTNNTSANGGGVYIAHAGSVSSCTFTNNTASSSGGKGGAIFYEAYLPNIRPMLTVFYCTITNNSAGYGGGIYSNYYTVLSGNSIRYNTAYINGGGIFFGNGAGYSDNDTNIIINNSPNNIYSK